MGRVHDADLASHAQSGDPAAWASIYLRQIVWDAAGGLAPRDRAVLELHLRHELVGQDLAEALGASPHHATVLLGRVRDLVERRPGDLVDRSDGARRSSGRGRRR